METENEDEDENADDEGAQPADMLDQVRARGVPRVMQTRFDGTPSTGPVTNRPLAGHATPILPDHDHDR